MKEGTCAFSGLPIKKGSGTTYVRADGKAFLLSSRKVRNFDVKKIKSRDIRWTQPAREALKKENVTKEQKIEIPRVVKIVRGFPSVPAHVIEERQERARIAREEKEKREKSADKEKIAVDKSFKVSKHEMRKRK